MTVLDAFALIAFFAGEPAAEMVEAELRRDEVIVSSVNWAEVIDRLVRVVQLPEEKVAYSLELVKSGGLAIAAVDETTAELAGRLRARHYRKLDAPVSPADCMALALCCRQDGILATADPALARMARDENVTVLALPDSRGRTP